MAAQQRITNDDFDDTLLQLLSHRFYDTLVHGLHCVALNIWAYFLRGEIMTINGKY
jgi:hypothetical protein